MLERMPQILAVLSLLAISSSSFANNGLNFIGFGSESLGMGGADIAVARDTTSLNTNPAGLAQTTQEHRGSIDIYGTVSAATDVAHKDGLGNDEAVSRKLTPAAGLGIAWRVPDSGITLGLGFFLQGGAGNEFQNLKTAFGTRDDVSARLVIAKLSPGIAYELSDRLRIGVVVSPVFATLDQKVLPGTSFFNALNPPASFFGLDADGFKASGINPRVGFQYEPNNRLVLAAVYSSKTKLDFDGGTLKSNQGAIGLGAVTYRDARIDGFALPQEASIGAAWKTANQETLISVKLAWLNWADALEAQTITATNPDNPSATPTLQRTTRLDWRDQYVAAVGVAHKLTGVTTVYGGFNFANNPVPSENLTLLLSPAIARRHLTTGLSHQLAGGSKLSGGLVYVFPEKVNYTNSGLPVFGANTQERIEYLGFNLTWSTAW